MSLTLEEWKRARDLFIDEMAEALARKDTSREHFIYLLGKASTLLLTRIVE